MAVIINFSLNSEGDKDILRWLESQPNRSAAIRSAIRAYMAERQGPTIADVLAEIRALPSKLATVSTPQASPEPEGNEPQAAAANLDSLLDRLGDIG